MPPGRNEISTTNSRDRILKHLQDDKYSVELSDEEERILARWDLADDLLRQYNKERDVVAMLMHKFKVSKATAINDVMNAKLVYGYSSRIEKDYERRNIKEITSEIIAACMKVSDFTTVLRALKIRIVALGLNKEDPDIPDWGKIEQHVFNIVYDPTLVGAKKIENLEEVVEKYLQEKRKKAIENIPEAVMEE